jgi:hypothetical protein
MTALDDARAYLVEGFGPQYDAWMALGDVPAQQTLVSATRYLNQLAWQGTATGLIGSTPTSLAWPRSGVFVDGVPVDSTTIPDDITKASFELAVLILADPTLPGKLDQGSNLQSANAGGGTGVTFFSPTSARQGTATALPVIVMRLVAKYLATAGSSVEGGFGRAGGSCSQFAQQNQLTLIQAEE